MSGHRDTNQSVEPVLLLQGLTKRFGPVTANDSIDLTVASQEIHAIVGENGAGKSTLMSMLYGILQPDAGEIWVKGEQQHFRNPLDAMDVGLGMVFQEFQLFDSLSVVENVIYRREPRRRGPIIDLDAACAEIDELARSYGLSVDPLARVEQLSVGQRQRVEVLKALYRHADILILDEPTAVLTPQETSDLLGMLKRLRDGGRTIVFITHKLREVMDVADHATVLHRGRVVASRLVAETSPTELSADMTGRTVVMTARAKHREPGRIVVDVSELCVERTDDGDGLATDHVSFTIGAGEILGVAAIAGNGQEELVRAIVGLAPMASGTIGIDGVPVHALSTRQRRRHLAYVPEDRKGIGSAASASIQENLLMGFQREPRLCSRGWLNRREALRHAEDLIDRFGVVTNGAAAKASSLSGGNLQKVLLGRELARSLPVLVVEQPTRGVDIGAIEFIHQELLRYRDAGGAVLLVSAELSELLKLSTRIAVMSKGRLVTVVEPEATSETELGLYMSGAATS